MKIAFPDIRGIIRDRYDPEEARAGLLQLDKVREIVRNELLKLPNDVLLRRPREGAWHIVEIIRHLVLSEDDRINYWILDNGKPPTALGMPPDFLRDWERYRGLGEIAVDDVQEVFDEWDEIHRTFTEYAESMTEEDLRMDTSERDLGQGDVGTIIEGMIDHGLGHYDSINRILMA